MKATLRRDDAGAQSGRRQKWMWCVLALIGCFLLTTVQQAYGLSGTLTGTVLCPLRIQKGVADSAVFPLTGTPPPAGAKVTLVSGTCDIKAKDLFPKTMISIGNKSGLVGARYRTQFFNGEPPTFAAITMGFPGKGLSHSMAGKCTIWISWRYEPKS